MNPKLIRVKLEAFVPSKDAKKAKAALRELKPSTGRGSVRQHGTTKEEASHENHERWLVSYADFITLLFAFFVVMFASSQTDKSRARQISEAVEKALADGKSIGVPPAVAKILAARSTTKDRATRK